MLPSVQPPSSPLAAGPANAAPAEPVQLPGNAAVDPLITGPAGLTAAGGRPAVVIRSRSRWRRLLFWLLLALAGGGGAAGWLWWQQHQAWLPAGIAAGNGRIEADDIDVTPKYAGRVAELLVDEGDLVQAGQIVARMDTSDVEATLRRALAQVGQAARALDAARASVVQQATQQRLARQQLARTQALFGRGFATGELLDQRRQQLDAASAALTAAQARVGEAEQAQAAAQQDVAYNQVVVAEGVLRAPRTARVQYRLVNTGEVIAAGARVFTLLDLSTIYMTIFLPTDQAGQVSLGAEGRVVLDALPGLVLPGRVTFLSSTAQFTPKMVETRSERDKLMFRIKVRIDPDLVARHLAEVRTGLPGVAYVRLKPETDWPSRLRPAGPTVPPPSPPPAVTAPRAPA